MKDILLVSVGAICGANIRFILYQKLGKFGIAKDIATLIINTLSSFSLGLFLSAVLLIRSSSFSNQLGMFFFIGFFGSISTFSTFIYDLFELCIKSKFLRAMQLLTLSIPCGTVALVCGFLLGSQYDG